MEKRDPQMSFVTKDLFVDLFLSSDKGKYNL